MNIYANLYAFKYINYIYFATNISCKKIYPKKVLILIQNNTIECVPKYITYHILNIYKKKKMA